MFNMSRCCDEVQQRVGQTLGDLFMSLAVEKQSTQISYSSDAAFFIDRFKPHRELVFSFGNGKRSLDEDMLL